MLAVLVVFALMPSQVKAEGSFKGYMASDYYYVLNHHDSGIEGRHGLWFRRIYLTYNGNVTDSIKMRLRFEMNSPGDYASSNTLDAFVKDAYLSFKLAGQSVNFGIIGPPTFGEIEDIWGYRALEKTPLDLYKLRSSRDFGIAVSGNFDKGKTVSYTLMFGNGSSNKAETNNGKMIYGCLGFRPVKGMYIEAYGDYEDGGSGKKYYVYQGFASYSGDWGRVGFQYSNKHYDHEDTSMDWALISGFAVVKAAKGLDVILRYDKMLDRPVPKTVDYIPFSTDATHSFIIAGLSFEAAKNIRIIPNVKLTMYDDPDDETIEKPGNDVYANLTLWFKF